MSRAISIFAAVSALLLILAAGAWVGSFLGTRGIRYQTPLVSNGAWRVREYGLFCGRGRWVGYRSQAVFYPGTEMPPHRTREWLVLPPVDVPTAIPAYTGTQSFLGFRYFHDPGWPGATWLVVPAWAPVALTAMLPIAWLVALRHVLLGRQRRQLGLCMHCGYNLKASRDRCPECGAAFEAA